MLANTTGRTERQMRVGDASLHVSAAVVRTAQPGVDSKCLRFVQSASGAAIRQVRRGDTCDCRKRKASTGVIPVWPSRISPAW